MNDFVVNISGYEVPSSPQYLKKRALANFFKFFNLNPHNAFKKLQIELGKNNETNSKTWIIFNIYLNLYVNFLSPKYLLNSHVLLHTAGGYADKSLLPGGKNEIENKEIKRLPHQVKKTLREMRHQLANKFHAADESVCFYWLSTYQLGPVIFKLDQNRLDEQYKNCIYLEIGAGIGANALVFAQLYDNDVFI